jgi:hypothetical protein
MLKKAFTGPSREQRRLFLLALHSLVNAKETTSPTKAQPNTVAWIWREGKGTKHLKVRLSNPESVAGEIYIVADHKGEGKCTTS